MLLSSIFTNSPVVFKVFSLSFAVVINTLSAFLTYIAALLLQVISTFLSTSCTLSVSPVSTIICPSERVPDNTYTPSLLIVTTVPSMATPLSSQLTLSFSSLILIADCSS